jgi:hypothetical protein
VAIKSSGREIFWNKTTNGTMASHAKQAITLVTGLFLIGVSASEAQESEAIPLMDPISEVITLPDACDNPTTRKWGPEDELGNQNYLTPDRVSKNLSLIQSGKVYNLAHVIEPGQMGFDGHFDFRTDLAPWPGRGAEEAIFIVDETIGNSTHNPDRKGILQGEIGTQLDGFLHATMKGIAYNCYDVRDPANHLLAEGDPGDLPKGNPKANYIFRGHNKLGIQNVGTIIARAILIDVGQLLRERESAAGRDPNQFPPSVYEFTPEDLEQALIRQGLTVNDIHPGDALLIRTGWAAKFWTSNPDDPRDDRKKYYNFGQSEEVMPGGTGLSLRAVQWTINRAPVLVSADTKSIESRIGSAQTREPAYSVPGHVSWLASGIHLLEDVDLEVLAADCENERIQEIAKNNQPRSADKSCYISTLIVPTIPTMGAAGSTVAPTVIR